MNLRAFDDAFWLGMIGWVFIVIGLIFARVSYLKVREALASRRWPQAVATLQRVEAATSTQPAPSGSDRAPSLAHGVRVEYAYAAGDAMHPAHDWLPAKNRDDAERLAGAQQPGATRTIVYDPADPSYWLLQPASSLRALAWLLPCAAFAGFGVLLIYVGQAYY